MGCASWSVAFCPEHVLHLTKRQPSPGHRLTTLVFSLQMIVRVFADDAGEDESLVTDVPVTPDTTCRDVIECSRDPGDEHCALVETWGSGHGECCGYW